MITGEKGEGEWPERRTGGEVEKMGAMINTVLGRSNLHMPFACPNFLFFSDLF